MHRRGVDKITKDLVVRTALGSGQVESQVGQEVIDQRPLGVVADADSGALEFPLAPHERNLNSEQFVIDESTFRLGDLGHRLGCVNLSEGFGASDQGVSSEEPRWDRVGQAAERAAAQGLADRLGNLGGADAGLLAVRIHRHDAAGLIADQVDESLLFRSTWSGVRIRMGESIEYRKKFRR